MTASDPTLPPEGRFSEPWHARTLAMANALIKEGHISAAAWAAALGAELKAAEAAGAPDTEATYYTAALSALERISEDVGIAAQDRDRRKAAWEAAYRRTPHGKPVEL